MIRIHYLDGQTVSVEGTDEWSTNNGVLTTSKFAAPMMHVRGWEVVAEPLPVQPEPVEPGLVDSESEQS